MSAGRRPTFGVVPLLDGYAAEDVLTGHQVGRSYPSRRQANGTAQRLNAAAAAGPAALARALGAHDGAIPSYHYEGDAGVRFTR